MPTKEKKTKAQIAAAAAAGSKARRKKNVKGRKADKVRNAVVFDDALVKKLLTEVPKMKVITPHIVSERLRVAMSLAKEGIRHLEDKGMVKRVSDNVTSMIYTRV